MKKIIVLGFLLSTSAFAAPQVEGEPVKAQGDIPLTGFTGCAVQPPKNGCDARISCFGTGTLFGKTGVDVQAATDDALMEAKAALAKFYNEKQKAEQSIVKAQKDSAKSAADGGKQVSTSMTRLITSVRSNSAEAVLSGVQTLGRTVDIDQQLVTMKIGVSCKSQAAAAQSKANALKSGAPSTKATSDKNAKKPLNANDEGEAYKLEPNTRNSHQEIQNADDF